MAINTAYASSEEQVIRESTKGLPFMALQFNVLYKRRQLAINKEVTPSEYYLLEEIEIGTIGARNGRSQICSKAEFYLEDLSNNLGYKKVDKLWKLLKSLHKKKLITREKTRDKGKEILGLDPEAFGQVLIDTQHTMEKKRHLKLVDNSSNPVDNSNEEPMNRPSDTDESSRDNSRNVGTEPTIHRENETQTIENIEENPPLDSFRFNIDSFRGKMGEIKSPQQTGTDWTKEPDTESKRVLLKEQLQLLKAGKI